jgi:RND family efflux transporter MFP subunit
VVVAEHVGVGEWLDVGGAVVEMVSLTDIEVVSMVPGRYLPEISIGQEVRVTFEALPGLEVIGRVSAVIPRADPKARTFPVKARIDNPGGRIGIGMLARVALGAGAQALALIVPKDAVVDQGAGQQVFLIGDDGTVQQVAIATGRGFGEWIVVEGDLRPGQKVVVRGNERLMPGQQVVAEELEYKLP